MAGCLQTISAGVQNFKLANDSDVFGDISGLVSIPTLNISDISITAPDLSGPSFNVDLPEQGDARLQDVGPLSVPPLPQFSGEFPSLVRPAHSAIMSTIAFDHESQQIPDITYIPGRDFFTLPNASPGAPPIDYPQESPLTLPARPGVGVIDVPDLSPGQKPGMDAIQPIQFQPSGLEPLEFSELPEFKPPDVEKLQWQDELKYEDDAALREQMKELMRGDGEARRWLDGLVQERLHSAETRKLPVQVKQQMDQVFEGAAGRNFSLPHGAVDKAAAAVLYEELDQSFDAAQQVGSEVYEAAINAVTTAIQQSFRIEQYHFNLYLRYVRQNLRVYQRNIDLAAEIYNSLVQAYNRASSLINTQVDAYNRYLRAVSAENTAASDVTDLQAAQIRTFRAKIDMFRADVGLRAKAAQLQRDDVRQQIFPLDEYEAELQGKIANLQILEQNTSAFRESIQAYSQQFDWYDDAVAAFESATDASTSKVQVNSTKFESYRRLWAGERDRTAAYQSYLDSSFSALDSQVRQYRQAAQSEQNYLQSASQSVSASLQGINAYSQMASQTGRHVSDYNSAKIGYTAARDSVEISASTTQLARESIAAEAAVQQASLDAAKESSKLDAAGALSQSASSIFQVSVGAEGTASERVSGRDAGSVRGSAQERRQFSQSCVETTRPTTQG